MNTKTTNTATKINQVTPAATKHVLQRQCACGNHTTSGGECTTCAKKKLQRKLSIGASNDPLELEADRVADQVLAYQPTHSFSNISAPKIQRRAEQSSQQSEEVPASVERVLASSGSPLPITVRKDMEQRFGQDFSQIRMHTGSAAEQSASDVNANAYTVGNNIVFNRGKFSPETQSGKHLLAHELTHVVQQSSTIRRLENRGDTFPASVSSPLKITENSVTAGTLLRDPTSEGKGGATRLTRPQIIQRILKPNLNLEQVMSIVDNIRPSESASGEYILVGDGMTLTISENEYSRIRSSAQKTLLEGLQKIRNKASNANDQYNAQHAIDEDMWITSHVVRFVGGINEPGPIIRKNLRIAAINATAAQIHIQNYRFLLGAQLLKTSETHAIAAKTAAQAYVDNVISTGEATVTVLEVTAITAGVAVVVIGAVLAAPAIAAAAQAAPLALALTTGAMPAAAPVVAAETVAIAAPAAVAAAPVAIAAPAALAVPAAAVATPALAAPIAAATIPAATSTLSTAALATAGIALTSTTLSSDSPPVDTPKEKEDKKKKSQEYPLFWPALFGPPMLFGVPITSFIRTPKVERDQEYAWEVRRELWARHSGKEPDLMPPDYHAHHIVPLFLGGLEGTRGNITFLPGPMHLRGHGQLASQPQMETPPPPLTPLPRNILLHPIGTRYKLVGFK